MLLNLNALPISYNLILKKTLPNFSCTSFYTYTFVNFVFVLLKYILQNIISVRNKNYDHFILLRLTYKINTKRDHSRFFVAQILCYIVNKNLSIWNLIYHIFFLWIPHMMMSLIFDWLFIYWWGLICISETVFMENLCFYFY